MVKNIFRGFLALCLSRIVSLKAQKVTNCPWGSVLSSKGYSCTQLYCYFFGLQTQHIIYSRAVLLGFLQCSYILPFNCQGLSNRLGLLTVRLNGLEASLIYLLQIYIFAHLLSKQHLTQPN